MKCHCRDSWQVTPRVWNMLINLKGGFEYTADVCKVYALVAH
jgi:hypothetical protein